MGDWNIKISKISNGYILEWDEEGDTCEDDEKINMIHMARVIEEKTSSLSSTDPEIEEKAAMVEVLEFVKDHFGFFNDKWKNNNIVVKLEDGYKLSDGGESGTETKNN